MNYYYFGASLPAVSMAAEPALRLAAFLSLADEQLLPADRSELRAVLDGHGRSEFGRCDREFCQRLALLCAQLRAERRGLGMPEDAGDEGVPDLRLRQDVADAFAATDPLERQRRLDRLHWQRLEATAAAAPFAAAAVFAYARRLQLAWQWHARTAAAGQQQLDAQRQQLLAAFAGMQITMTEGAQP